MKKKVFSLMMTLLLAFLGVANATVVTIGTSTSTGYVSPYNSLWGYSYVEQIYTASEIGTAGTITAISFNMRSGDGGAQTNAIDVFMKNVSRTTFASVEDYEPVTASNMVFSGTVTFNEGWTTITLNTPFEYDGTSNLMIGVHEKTSGYSTRYFYCTQLSNTVVTFHSDSADPNPYSLDGYTGNKYTSAARANIQININPAGGAGEQIYAVQYDEIVDTVYVGARPNGCWMEPFKFQIRNTGAPTTITRLDWTPEEYFTLVAPELPVQIATDEDIDVELNTGESTNTDWQMVAIYGDGRTAAIWTMVVEPYDPEIPDVVEKNYDFGTINAGFSYEGKPAQITPTTLHNDYTLPFPEIEEGLDAVYKFTVDRDLIINAYVDHSFPDGKVALYTEDFYGQGGPMADNNYQGLDLGGGGGGGGAAAPFEAQLGEGTSTSGYLPFYCFYNYSCSQQLFLAAELQEAGVTRAPMTSLSWYCTASNGNLQSNITIWMANVEQTSVGTSSVVTGGMTKVYEGNMTPTANSWNEFAFNQGSFSWDGHSNILVSVQRNNGAWASGISWQVGAQNFTAAGYSYNDSDGAYNMATTSYTFGSNGYSYGGTTTNRANIIMKGGNRDAINTLTACAGTDYNEYIPVYGYWADDDLCSQYIIPAAELTAMNGGTINSLTYVMDEPAEDPWTGTFKVYMKEVGYTEMTELVNRSSCTVVYTGSLNATGSTMHINLSTPYTYNGGNLLIGFDQEYGDNYSDAYFQGVNTSYTSALCGYGWGGLSYGDNWDYDEQFIPTTTFTYSGGSAPTPGPTPTPSMEVSAGPVISNLGLTPGTYYLVTSGADMNMMPRAFDYDYKVYINVDEMPCPAIEAEGFAFNPQPADNEDEVEPASVTLRWMVPEYATAWRLIFGSTYHPEPSHPQTIITDWSENMANSYTVTNLWNNTNYFWRVEFKNDGCPDGVSSPIWGFTTHLNVPQNLTAVDYTVFNDETITLNWNAVVDRTYRQYFIYRDGVKVGETTMNDISNTTYTDGPLAYNMNGYVYYVTAIYDEGESAPSNTVTVKVSGRGNVDGHVYEQDGETGIAGATVTMVGRDEFNDPHTYHFTTNGQGYYSGAVYAGEYNGQASKEGYQTIDHPVQGNPIDITYNETTSPIDYILDENFDPVCAVIAEYYPDSLDPESPYVKVYWGCGLPGSEIIEDFETGDFSMFDWQVDPTYPWSITTNNPYEGTYCMKSGGAGVANVVSNMTVTVDIPADGLMSFFGKISCENSWDYGYFYIDGVQKGSFTGAGNWIEKTYDITEGTHTFQWRYTKDSSVNSNDDCFYVDYINFYKQPEPPIPGMTYDFEDGTMQGWTSIDADGDGYGWYMGSEIMTGQTGNNGSNDFVLSQSYYLGTVLHPDNYLVSPQVELGGIVRFYACAQDASYPSEHFGLAVSTTNTNPSSFTMVQEWTMTAKSMDNGGKAVQDSRSGRAQGTWYEYTVDLSAYSGMGYVAIRHFNCSDMFYLNVDDITIGEPGKGMPSDSRRFSHYRVYRTDCYNDGPYTLYDPAAGEYGNTVVLACELHDTIYIDVSWPDAAPGVYKWGVGCVYVGNRGEEIAGPISWTTPHVVNSVVNAENSDLVDPNTPYVDVTGVTVGTPNRATRDDVLFDQAIFVTHPGVMAGGADASNLESDQTSFGPNVNWAAGSGTYYLLADDFTLTANSHITGFEVYGYQTGSSTTSTITGLYAQIFDGNPAAGGTAIWGDNATNLMTSTAWTNCYRTSGLSGTTRPIMSVTAEGLNIDLAAGTYYLVWGLTGTLSSGPWGAPVAILGQSVTGDALQKTSSGWQDMTLGTPQAGAAFLITGTTSGGGGGGGTSNGLQEPRESEIVWSNCLDKDMYLDNVDVTVLLNSADSPEGTVVTLTNYNEAEQEMYPVAPVELDETGFYAWDSFRKGEYKVKVELEGYEPIEDSVSIWDETHLRYVMIEILYGVENVYVSRTGWAMWDDSHNNPGGGGGGGGTGAGDTFSDDFEGGLGNWTLVDADADGHNWYHSSMSQTYSCYDYTGWGHNSSNGFAVSQSYTDCTYDSYDPNNFMITNQKYSIGAGSTLNFWADYGNDSYPDHFGVAVATANNPTPADFTIVWEGNAKSGNAGKSQTRHDGDRYMNWRSHSVDLSAYAGQEVYIAFRHFNSYDEYEIYIDDVELTAGRSDERHLEYYKVMCTSIDGVPIYNHNTPWPWCQLSTDEPYNAPLVEGEHYLCKVAAVYSTGMSAWSEPVEWEYEPCDHWGPVDEVTVNTGATGNHIEWVFEHGFNPYDPGTGPTPPPATGDWYYYDNGVNVDAIGLTSGGSFYWGVMFPAGSYTGNMVTKVSMYDYSANNGNILVYQGGTTAPGSLVGQQAYTCTGSNDFVEWEFATPATIDPTQNLWIVMNNSNGQYVASCCNNTGNANGRWISLDGASWEDVATYGLDYTWMLRAYVAGGAKGEPQVLTYNGKASNGTPAISGNGPRFKRGEGVSFTMISENVLEFSITDIANYDGRVYFLHNLMNDNRFSVINAEQPGMFIVSANNILNMEESFADFVEQTTNSFARMDKYAAADYANQYKGTLPASFINNLMMDMYIQSRENNMCEFADPFCTDNGMYEFPAGVNAGSGETGPDYDCLYTQPNPAWYYMRIGAPGEMDIHMYSTPQVDIDFCCWGPFDDPTTPCPYGLTEDKVVSCSYSTSWTEHCMIPATAQTGEYYILVITNYSNNPCNINFSMVAGNGSTDCGILPPVDIIGFLITQDGEYLAFAGPTDREYIDLDEYGDHEYCVRPIYPGEMVLPSNNFGWSMGCPVCAETNGQIVCDMPYDINIAQESDMSLRVWWGEEPAAPVSEWLYYDDGTYATSVGAGGTLYWGTMFPAASLAPYAGTSLTKVAVHTSYACSATLNVYVGGAQPGGSPAATQTFTMPGDQEFTEITLTNAVPVDGTQNLWITFYQSGETYPADACADTGDANNRWVSVDGASWMDLASAGLPGYGWMIRGFVTNQAKGGELASLPEFKGNVGGQLSHSEVVSKPADLSFMNRATLVKYNVYRSTDAATGYEFLGSVAEDGSGYYEYIDTPVEAGTYYYQVRAEYDNECESEPAMAADGSGNNYVSGTTIGDGMDELGNMVNLYPNPTKGNVTIEANGMSRITVVSVLGQVVFDTELDADNYTLNMGQFTAGMYMVRVYTENGVTVKRVTVMQ